MPRSTKRDPSKWSEPNHDKPVPRYVGNWVWDRANGRCAMCGFVVKTGGHIDHVIPLIDAKLHPGRELHASDNLQLLCPKDHNIKTTKENMARAQGRRTEKSHREHKASHPKWGKRKQKKTLLPKPITWTDETGRRRVTCLKGMSDD